jgi:asparagine synthase (glutamine-hydrolysing)
VDPAGSDENFARHPMGWLSRAELSTYTYAQLLRDTDVMSMAHSLEVRVPFLDHRLVEAILALPSRLHQSRRGQGPKPLLMSAIGPMLPPIIRERKGKQGFIFPFDRWLRGPLDSQVRVLLDSAVTQRWLQSAAVQDVWTKYHAEKIHWSRLWALAVLQSSPMAGM